ncbi:MULTISPECIES: hypothetical protein, partial [unclassified Pseudomonas]
MAVTAAMDMYTHKILIACHAAIASKLNWSSNPGHRLRCLCRLLLHGYWRQIVVVAVEPGAVVV